jgi:hypothetical protein
LTAVANGEGGFAVDGEAGDDYSGFAVAGAGDVDGDGFADIIVGAFGNDAKGASAGRSYVVLGGDYSNLVRQIGGPGPDNLAGTAEAELFIGGRGDDTVTGEGGADIIYTGAGKDLDPPRRPRVSPHRRGPGRGHPAAARGGSHPRPQSAAPDDLVGVEIFDLADGDHTLTLTRRELLALTPISHEHDRQGQQGQRRGRPRRHRLQSTRASSTATTCSATGSPPCASPSACN